MSDDSTLCRCSTCGYAWKPGMSGSHNCLAILVEQRDAAIAINEMSKKMHEQKLESDSIGSSCGCMTKTPEASFHKPGCRYRLIMERDAAITFIKELNATKAQAGRIYRARCGRFLAKLKGVKA